MNLKEYAELIGVDWTTAKRYYQQGLIPGAFQTVPRGTIYVPDDILERNTNKDTNDDKKTGKTIIYARVSSRERSKTDLPAQAERIKQYCLANGWSIDEIIMETASGVNDARPKLMRILTSKEPIKRIVIEHKDRLTRTGYNYIKTICDMRNTEIIIMNKAEDDTSDIINDMTSILYSFMAKIYSIRRTKNKMKKIEIIINDRKEDKNGSKE